MNFSNGILFALLLGTYAQSTDTNLATNTNIILILLLALYGANGNGCNNCGQTLNTCCNGTSLF